MIFFRKFKFRERLLLCVLAVIIVAACYLLLVQLPVSNSIEQITAEKTALEDELLTLEIMKIRYGKMAASLDELGDNPSVETPEYDNLLMLMGFLNGALASAEEFELSFDTIETDEETGIVRRNVNMTFKAGNYYKARNIINTIHNCPYRCIISDLQIVPFKDKAKEITSLTVDEVTVSMSVTFFERISN